MSVRKSAFGILLVFVVGGGAPILPIGRAAADCIPDFQDKTAKDLNACIQNLQERLHKLEDGLDKKAKSTQIVSAGFVDSNGVFTQWDGGSNKVSKEKHNDNSYKFTFVDHLTKDPIVLAGPVSSSVASIDELIVTVSNPSLTSFEIQAKDVKTNVLIPGGFWYVVLPQE